MAARRTPKPLDLAPIVKARMEAKGISANALEQLVGGAVTRQTIGTFISGGTQMGNWTRFARTGRVAIAGTFVAVIVVQFAMLFFGGVGATAFGQSDFAELLVQLGLLGAGLFLLVANLWTTNDNTAYAFGLAGAELFNKSDKRPFIIAGVILGIIIAIITSREWDR